VLWFLHLIHFVVVVPADALGHAHAVKTGEQQAALMLAGMRDQWLRRRTQLTNAIRGYAAEFAVIAAKG
jgi:transposase